MAVPLSASTACKTTRSSGTGRRLLLCSFTSTAKSSSGCTGRAGSCSVTVTSLRSVRTYHAKKPTSSTASDAKKTANDVRLTAAAANSTASSSAQPTLPAMERFLRAGARHGVQNIVKDILHCIAAGAGLFGQAHRQKSR